MSMATEDPGRTKFRLRLFLGLLTLLGGAAFVLIAYPSPDHSIEGKLKLSYVRTVHLDKTNQVVFLAENLSEAGSIIIERLASSRKNVVYFWSRWPLPPGARTNVYIHVPPQSGTHQFSITYSKEKSFIQKIVEAIKRKSVRRMYTTKTQWPEE